MFLLALTASLAGALPQSEPPRPRRVESKGIDLPDAAASAPSSPSAKDGPVPRAAAPPPDWPAGSGRADLLLRECLRRREAGHPLALEARRALLEMGSEAHEAARAALGSKHPAVLSVAAEVVGPPGEPAAAAVLRALESGPPREAVHPLVRALDRLDAEGAPSAWIGLLVASSGTVRAQAAASLEGRIRPAHLPLLLETVRRAPTDSKERIVALLAPFGDRDVLECLSEGLDDPAARVAIACATALARSRAAEERLNERIATGIQDRGWAYACLALSIREDLTFEPAIAAGAQGPLLRGIASADPFVSGAAAVALATTGFRAESDETPEVLDRLVPRVLVASVAGDRFFKDYASLNDLALRRLALLSGESTPRSGPQWAAWWLARRDGFRAQRAALPITEPDERALVVVYERTAGDAGDAVRLRVRFEGSTPPEMPGAGEEILLDAPQASALAAEARAGGLLGSGVRPGVRGAGNPGARRLLFLVGDRRKEIGFGPAGAPEPFDAFEARLLALARENRWQRYFDPEAYASRAAFLEAGRAFAAAPRDPLETAGRWKNLVLGALDDLDEPGRVGALRELAGVPEMERVFLDGDVPRLLAGLSSASSPKESDRIAMELLLRFRGAAAVGAAGEAVATRFGVRGLPLLAGALSTGPAAAVEAALADARPLVRAAGAEAAGERRDPAFATSVVGLLAAEEESVRGAAARALGRIGAAETDGRLAALAASDPSVEVRRAALLSLGRLGGAAAIDALQRAVADPDEGIRAAAIEGLAECRDDRAAGLLASVFVRGGAPAEGARRGLLRLGPAASGALAGYLTARDPEVRRAVRFVLAETGDGRAFPGLLDDLTVSPDDARTADALARLAGVDFGTGPDAIERARDWWSRNRGKNERVWFCDGLAASGVETTLRPDDLRADAGAATLEPLAAVVERAPWPLAARGAAWARTIGRRDFGSVARETSPLDRASLAQRIRESIRVR